MGQSKGNKSNKKSAYNFFSNKKVQVITIVSSVSIILVLIAVFSYFYIYRTPRRIIKDMQGKMSNIKTIHHKTKIEISGNVEGVNTNLKLDLEGNSDKGNKEYPKNSFTLNTEGDLSVFSLDSDLEFRSFGNELYLKVSKFPNISALYGDSFNILNRWAKTDIQGQNNSGDSLSELLRDDNLFKDIKPLKSEKVTGVNTYHYRVIVNKESLSKIFSDQSVGSILTYKELENFKNFVYSLSDSPLDIWVGKRDSYLYKLSGSISQENEETKTMIKFSSVFGSFNQPVSIDLPEKSEPLETVFGSFVETFKKLQAAPI